jgi:hypothetical protein
LPAPATLGLDHLGRPLTWKACLSGPNRDIWLDLSGAELLKLIRTTGSLKPCFRPTKKATYYNQVPGEKWKNNEIVRRVRGTGGGDRIQVEYSVATPTANLPTVKCILHATVSEDAFFGVIDITDFYLGSPMPFSEFLKLYTSDYRPALLDDLGITPFIQCDNTGKYFFYANQAFPKPDFMLISSSCPISPNTVTTRHPPPLSFAMFLLRLPSVLLLMILGSSTGT